MQKEGGLRVSKDELKNLVIRNNLKVIVPYKKRLQKFKIIRRAVLKNVYGLVNSVILNNVNYCYHAIVFIIGAFRTISNI